MSHRNKMSVPGRKQSLRSVHVRMVLQRKGECGETGKTAAHGSEEQGPTTGPVLDAARFIPIARSVDLRCKPNRSDKTQNHRSKHWLSSAVGTETFV